MTPNPDPTGPIASAIALEGLGLIFAVLIAAGVIALQLWILYSVIWRAVRRGLVEYNYPGIKIKGLSGRSVPGRADGWSLDN
jgi:hypothetical protein